MTTEAAVEVDDLVVRYGEVTAVDGLSFAAHPGEIVALLGPNGAGKTSTVETLEGFHRPTDGSVRVLGFDPVVDHRRVVPHIGVMLQQGGVYTASTASRARRARRRWPPSRPGWPTTTSPSPTCAPADRRWRTCSSASPDPSSRRARSPAVDRPVAAAGAGERSVRAYAAQVRAELGLSLRQGEQLLVSVGIPLLLLVFFGLVDVLPKPAGVVEPVDFLTPGILALAIMSSAMVSLGIGTGFERHYKVLKRLGVTPLGRGRLVAAKITMVLAVQVVQVALIVVVAVALGWRAGGPVALVLPGLVLGTAAFAGLGLLLAGTLSGPLNLAVCNGLYLILLLLGGMVIPLEKLPTAIRAVAELLPAGALAEIMTGAVTAGSSASARAWLVLVAWAVAMPLLAVRFFRWE